MNDADFRSATLDMEDTALWDVRRITLQAARRDDATPVRYFEDAVTETLRSLHRVYQESVWDELQKHELGKRTLRALAAEYKPARMVALEPEDLRKASVRFWEALRTEDDAVREALASYNYSAVTEQLAKLSTTLDREVVQRLVYINCPRQNVVEEVVGTIHHCTTNGLKMLASKLYDRLDKTGSLSAENRDIAKKLPQCKTKEELRVAVRDLLQMFKRKQHGGDSSSIIGPSVATVTVSYKGQQRQVAAVVRIERLDKIAPDEVKVDVVPASPPPAPAAPSSIAQAQSPVVSAQNSEVTVGSDRTIPASTRNAKIHERSGAGSELLFGSLPASNTESRATSVVEMPRNVVSNWATGTQLPSSEQVRGLFNSKSALDSDDEDTSSASDDAASSFKGGYHTGKSSLQGSVVGAGSDTGSLRSITSQRKAMLSESTQRGNDSFNLAPGTDLLAVREPQTSTRTTPRESAVNAFLPSIDMGATARATPKTTTPASALGVPPPPSSDLGSIRSGPAHRPATASSAVHSAAVPSSPSPGSDVGSVRSGSMHRRTPAGSVIGGGGGARAAAPGSMRSAQTTPAGSVVGEPTMTSALPGSNVPASVIGSSKTGAGSVTNVSMSRQSSQTTLTTSDATGRNHAVQNGYGSISFDHQGLPPPGITKPRPSDVEGTLRSDEWHSPNEGGSERSSSPSISAHSSRAPSRIASMSSRKSLAPMPRSDSLASSRQLEAF